MLTNHNVGSLFSILASHLSLSSSEYTIDHFHDVAPFFWVGEEPALDAIVQLLNIGHHFSYVDGNGVLNFRNRYHGITNPIVASLDNSFFSLGWALSQSTILNNLRVTGVSRYQVSGVQTVAFLQDKPFIAANSVYSFEIAYINPDNPTEVGMPVSSLITPVLSADYTTNTVPDNSGAFQTTLLSLQATLFSTYAVCSMFNTSSFGVYLTKFQIRGSSVPELPTLSTTFQESASVSKYGQYDFEVVNEYIGDIAYARDYAMYLAGRWAEPVPNIEMAIKNVFPQVLDLELATQVSAVESNTLVGSIYIVKSVQHDVVMQSGLEHTIELKLERPTYGDFLVLDHDPKGRLDNRRLAF